MWWWERRDGNAMGNECITTVIRRQQAPANVFLLHCLVAEDARRRYACLQQQEAAGGFG